MGAETDSGYVEIARKRIQDAINGTLRTRPMNKPKYDPTNGKEKRIIPELAKRALKFKQTTLAEGQKVYGHEDSCNLFPFDGFVKSPN